jgi:prevent-host-death family protein
MPVIKPISDLRNKANEISHLAHSADEPIFITRNGEGDLVVMSITHYAKMQKKLELLNKLSAAQAQRAAGDGGRPLADVVRNIRKRLRVSA